MTRFSYLRLLFICLLSVYVVGCKESSTANAATTEGISPAGYKKWRTPTPTPTATPKPTATPTPTATPVSTATPTTTPTATPSERVALIYNGAGAHPTGYQSIGSILQSKGIKYVYADHNALNAMSLETLTKFSILIFPGGDSNQMDAAITGATRLRVKQAVVSHGVSYTGFCAGAWMAVGPAQSLSSIPYWGFGFIAGNYLKQYYPNGQNPESAMLSIRFATGETRQIVWWRGPVLPEISGGVNARHSDGSPAFVGTWAGKGYVTMTGPHPEAPPSWSYGFTDADGSDYDIAWRTIQSALDKKPLVAY